MKLLTMEDVEARWGPSVATQRHWRASGTGPKAARIGRRVMYRESDIEAWINSKFDDAEGQ